MVHVSEDGHDGLANGSHRHRTKNPSLLEGCGPYHRRKPLTEVICQYGGIEVRHGSHSSGSPAVVSDTKCGGPRRHPWRRDWSLAPVDLEAWIHDSRSRRL